MQVYIQSVLFPVYTIVLVFLQRTVTVALLFTFLKNGTDYVRYLCAVHTASEKMRPNALPVPVFFPSPWTLPDGINYLGGACDY